MSTRYVSGHHQYIIKHMFEENVPFKAKLFDNHLHFSVLLFLAHVTWKSQERSECQGLFHSKLWQQNIILCNESNSGKEKDQI